MPSVTPIVHSRQRKEIVSTTVRLKPDAELRQVISKLLKAINPETRGTGKIILNLGEFTVVAAEWFEACSHHLL